MREPLNLPKRRPENESFDDRVKRWTKSIEEMLIDMTMENHDSGIRCRFNDYALICAFNDAISQLESARKSNTVILVAPSVQLNDGEE